MLAGPRYLRVLSSFLHRLLAAAGVVLVLVLGVLAANPELHQRLHPDAGQAGHECGVTMFLHGVEAVLVTAVLTVPAQFLLAWVLAPRRERWWAAPWYWLPPGRAPPVG